MRIEYHVVVELDLEIYGLRFRFSSIYDKHKRVVVETYGLSSSI